ncbi:MAG: DUF58 domain-containing protein [Lachnospiraceae bacterium]|nr:DUF58 domain-containing protein [Lachnospiraceae bacterium]
MKMIVSIPNIILYIGAIALVLATIILLEQPFLIVLLFPFILIPALELPLFFKSVSQVSVEAHSNAPFIETGNEIPVLVSIHNHSFFPFLHCRLKCYVNNLFYPKNKESLISFPLLPKKESTNTVSLLSSGCGMATFEICEIMLTDLLGFFIFLHPVQKRVDIPILPKEEEIEIPTHNTLSDGMDEFEESDLKGNVSSDIKEIREYHPGDRLQRIHWKLSAKLDDLFVKEMAHTSILSMVLLPELNKDTIEDTVSTLYNLSRMLIQDEERFEICLYHENAMEFQYRIISGNEDLIDAFRALYYLPLYTDPDAAKNYYYSTGQKNASILHIKGCEINVLSKEV